MDVGVAMSLSCPEMETGDGGGSEEEMEVWKRRAYCRKVVLCVVYICMCVWCVSVCIVLTVAFAVFRFCTCLPVVRHWTCWSSL